MKNIILMGLCVLLLSACSDSKNIDLKSDRDRYSYAIGLTIGKNIPVNNFEFDKSILLTGIEHALNKQSLMTSKNIQEAVSELQVIQRKSKEKKIDKIAQSNFAKQKKFLETNASKKGVNTLQNGVQYKILKEGNGKSPTNTSSKVKVHYSGKLLNGKEFDSSYKREMPLEIQLNQVIQGWSSTLQLMKEGDIWEVYIPSDLGYGNSGAGSIGPNELLIFKIELLEVLK